MTLHPPDPRAYAPRPDQKSSSHTLLVSFAIINGVNIFLMMIAIAAMIIGNAPWLAAPLLAYMIATAIANGCFWIASAIRETAR